MKREIKSSTAWMIVAAAVVLLFGGALSWAYYGEPNDYDYSNGGTLVQQKTETTAVDETADWKTYEVDNLGMSFKYPADWGEANIDSGKVKVESGYSYNISFSGNPKILAGFASADMSAGREGRFYEMININKNVSKIKDCDSFKTYSTSDNLTTCSNIEKSGKIIGILIVYNFPSDAMFAGPYTVAYYFTSNLQFPIVGFETDQRSSKISDEFGNIIKSFTVKTTAIASTTAVATSTNTTSAAWKSYQNTDYGFGLTFTDAWEGYKMKAVDLEGTVKTFYINVPTSDPLYASETSTAYAGYSAPFAISVIEKSKWQDDELFARDFGSKVGEKGDYVFTSSQGQACPTDLCGGAITSSIKTVMDSFKVL